MKWKHALDVEQQRPEMNMFCPSTTLIEGKRVANSSCQPHHLLILFDESYRIRIFIQKGREQQGCWWHTQSMIPNWSHHRPLVIGWPELRHNARTECRYMLDTMVIQRDNGGTPGRFEADGEDRLFTVKLDTSKWETEWHIMVVAR